MLLVRGSFSCVFNSVPNKSQKTPNSKDFLYLSTQYSFECKQLIQLSLIKFK